MAPSIEFLEKLKAVLANDHYFNLLRDALLTGDWKRVEGFYRQQLDNCKWQSIVTLGEKGSKYYKPFHKAVSDKLIDTLKSSLINESLPEIEIQHQELDEARKKLGLSNFGSPQDVLYGFTSERYKDWGSSLTGMGFKSACMSGEGKAVITLAPRFLTVDAPDICVDEMEGSITLDFWETSNIVAENTNRIALLDLCANIGLSDEEIEDRFFSRQKSKQEKLEEALKLCNSILSSNYNSILNLKSHCLKQNLELDNNFSKTVKKLSSFSQEQIGLKYSEEGKYLQKLLGGKRVEHLQSNVKMVKNPLRGNKCEVDSIYRILGEKTIVLLEAKGKQSVSRSQIYQLYETYRLKLPSDWELKVVVLLMSHQNTSTTIDMALVDFDDNYLGDLTESMVRIKPKKHIRWDIVNG